MLTILVTDALFWGLLITISLYAFYTARHEHLRRPWKQLARNQIAMVSLVIIIFYVAIALLDSIHIKPRLEDTGGNQPVYSSELISVFDIIVSPLRQRHERTYSEPFALYAYVKKATNANEMKKRIYPRLKYGGAHLQNTDHKMQDILALSLRGILEGLAVGILVLLLVAFWKMRMRGFALKQYLSGLLHHSEYRTQRTVMITLSTLFIICFVCFRLGEQYHILGTDKVGQDVFYQALKSIRTGVLIGTLTTLIMLPLAISLGIIAGYFLGRVDDVIQYIYMTLNSIPSVLLIAAAILMLYLYMNKHPDSFDNLAVRADLRLLFLCIILGVTSWTGLCRLLRAETLKIKTMGYIQSAQALGVSRYRIIVNHILPNVMHIVFITVALDFSGLVLAEAVLSYVSIGVDPTMHSWGNMINSARLEMARDPVVWWPLIASFIFMFGLVLCANLLADAVRDAFDPRTGAS